jgi:hypothetical protein
MTDRELLERAAKAAGMPLGEGLGELQWWPQMVAFARRNANGMSVCWNPLTDDGDAFALLIKLRLCLIPLSDGGWDVERYNEYGEGVTLVSCANGGDWAVRDCIVRAAASLSPQAESEQAKGDERG